MVSIFIRICSFATILLCLLGVWPPLSARAAVGCDANDPASSLRTATGDCLSFRASSNARPGLPLIVFMHGDGGAFVNDSTWAALGEGADALAAATAATFVVLVRPGYSGPGGRSSGSAKPNDDDYTAENARLVADAITALKLRLKPTRTIVGGTSGRAAIAALAIARHPGVADAAWLVACPCQIQPWRAWRQQSANRNRPWSASLSPEESLAGVPRGVRIAAVVGDKDQNTLPRFSEAYVAAAKARGIDASLTIVPGAAHGSAWRSREAATVLSSLPR